jgi:hypothetical protein
VQVAIPLLLHQVHHKQVLVEQGLLIGRQVQLKQEILMQQMAKVILLILQAERLQEHYHLHQVLVVLFLLKIMHKNLMLII